MRRPSRTLIWVLPFFAALFLGCAEDDVFLQGVIAVDHPLPSTAASDVVVSVLTGEGIPYSETVTDDQGLFRAAAPKGGSVHLWVRDVDGYTSSFRGVAGSNPRTTVPAGFAHTFGVSARELWLGRFSGCENVGEGGLTVGQIRVNLIENAAGEHPIARAAGVKVFNEHGEFVAEGCYLDSSGGIIAPDASYVGDTGYFGVFGLPAGRLILRVSAELVAGEVRLYEYDLFMPEDGSAPRFPVLIPFEM